MPQVLEKRFESAVETRLARDGSVRQRFSRQTRSLLNQAVRGTSGSAQEWTCLTLTRQSVPEWSLCGRSTKHLSVPVLPGGFWTTNRLACSACSSACNATPLPWTEASHSAYLKHAT